MCKDKQLGSQETKLLYGYWVIWLTYDNYNIFRDFIVSIYYSKTLSQKLEKQQLCFLFGWTLFVSCLTALAGCKINYVLGPQKVYLPQENYYISLIDLESSCQQLGIILENKVI